MRKSQQSVKWYGAPVLVALLMWAFTGCGPDESLGQSQQAVRAPKSIVLVHGAWMGGWAWDEVARHLREQGETVSVLTLPAHDTDPTPATSATLGGYVAAVANAVHSVPGPVYLVGHSAAGVVISQFAESEPSAVEQLVYVAAILPQDGQTLFDIAVQDQGSLILPNMSVDMQDYVVSLPLDQVPAVLCADCSPDEAGRLQSHYRGEPLIPAATPVHLTPERFGTVDKRYFFTLKDQTVTYPRQVAMASAVALTGTTSMDSYHCPQVTRAAEFSEKLLALMR